MGKERAWYKQLAQSLMDNWEERKKKYKVAIKLMTIQWGKRELDMGNCHRFDRELGREKEEVLGCH